MLDTALFVTPAVHARSIELPDGTQGEFHFRELRAAEIQRYRNHYNHKDAKEQDKAVPYLIAQSLCDAEGSAVITMDEAMRLKPAVADRFVGIALELAGFGEAGNR